MADILAMAAYEKAGTLEQQYNDITDQGNIMGFKVITQAEYDALPATKETDGIVYLIRG